MNVHIRDLEARIAEGENMNLEFKETLPPDSKKWAKTVVAFANGSGGTLLIGVSNDGRIVGVPEEEVYGMCDGVIDAISNICHPQISVFHSIEAIDGKAVIAFDVYPGAYRPYHVRSEGEVDGVYVRIDATTRHDDPHMLHELKLQGAGRTFDSLICPDMAVTSKNTSHICGSLSKVKDRQITETDLMNWGVIRSREGRLESTNAYALLLNENPFASAEVRCAVFDDDAGLLFVDQGDYTGSICDQVENACSFVFKNLRLSGKVEGIHRVDRYEIPESAIREAIINAVVHRSYAYDVMSISVALYNDRLEVTSPGGVYGSLGLESVMAGRSIRRNPIIARAFRMAGYSEGWSTGIRSIASSCKEYGLPDPKFIDNGLDFKVVLYKKVHDGNSSQSFDLKEGIMKCMEGNDQLRIKDLAESCDVSEKTIKRYIRDLKDEGMIHREGNAKSGRWIVNRKH